MKHLLTIILSVLCLGLHGQASIQHPVSTAHQNMPEYAPVIIEYDWLFNTNSLTECKPGGDSASDRASRENKLHDLTQDVKAYPNPNSVCLLTVDFEVTVPGSKLLLYDLNGTLLYSENLGAFTGKLKKQLDLSLTPSSVVILTILQNGVPSSQKIVVE